MLHFSLRPFRTDAPTAFVMHTNDPTVAANLTDPIPHPYTEAHARAFLEEAMQPVPLRRCIEVAGECVGAIGLHPKVDLWRCNMELGYWLAAAHRGKGIMTEAIRQLVPQGFATFPNVMRIVATPFGRNVASQKALEKAGFTLEAKLIGTLVKNGRVEDEWIYAVRR
ncbi:MAG: GNAT family N-acetyltransferase [Flavobacteriales bacterium]|jgi:RimJ/RimL family protein N-acetyltransferase|nr:GNAT family N-acetyltransferase [Flavobacteriales bacterium]